MAQGGFHPDGPDLEDDRWVAGCRSAPQRTGLSSPAAPAPALAPRAGEVGENLASHRWLRDVFNRTAMPSAPCF